MKRKGSRQPERNQQRTRAYSSLGCIFYHWYSGSQLIRSMVLIHSSNICQNGLFNKPIESVITSELMRRYLRLKSQTNMKLFSCSVLIRLDNERTFICVRIFNRFINRINRAVKKIGYLIYML